MRLSPDERVKQLCTTARRHIDAYENERGKWYQQEHKHLLRNKIAEIHRRNYNKTIDRLIKIRPDRFGTSDKLPAKKPMN